MEIACLALHRYYQKQPLNRFWKKVLKKARANPLKMAVKEFILLKFQVEKRGQRMQLLHLYEV